MDFCWLNPGGAPVPEGHAPAHVIGSINGLSRIPGL
jgi:hypothetical protein